MNKFFLNRLSALNTVLVLVVVLFCSSLAFPAGILTASTAPQDSMDAGVDLVLKKATLSTGVQILSGMAGLKVKAHEKLDEIVDVNIKGQTIESALDSLLTNKGYGWFIDDKDLHVFKAIGKKKDFSPIAAVVPEEKIEKIEVTKMIALVNRQAEGIVDTVLSVDSGLRILADVPTNSLIITGEPKAVARAEAMVKKIDQATVTRNEDEVKEFTSEVFTLEYVTDFEDLEDNLNFILYGKRGKLEETSDAQTAVNGVNQIRKEYYLFDKVRRILMITASQDKMDVIREYFTRINTPIPQVIIEAHIVALDAGFERKLGINWTMVGGYQGPVRPTSNPLGIPQSNTANNTTTDPANDFQFGRWNLSGLTALLESAQSNNKGKILSQPKLMTLSGHEAKIDISTRYPYKSSQTVNQTGTTENIEFVPVGITLTVKPQVNPESKTITMSVVPVISDLLGFKNDNPITTTRTAETMVEVKDGETIVIGGLIRDEELKEKNGVPVLKEIPVLGDFFRWSRKVKNRTNLVIMITPRLVLSDKEKVVQDKANNEVTSEPETKVKNYKERLEDIKKRYLGKS